MYPTRSLILVCLRHISWPPLYTIVSLKEKVRCLVAVFTYPCKSGSSVTFGPRAVKLPLLTSWTNFWPKCAKPRRLRFPLGKPRRRLGAIEGTPTFFLTLDHPTLPFGFEIGKDREVRGPDPHRAQTVRHDEELRQHTAGGKLPVAGKFSNVRRKRVR